MRVRGPNNVGRAAQKFVRFETLRKNMQQGVQTDATCNIQQCWELLANKVESVCTGLNTSKSWRKEGRSRFTRIKEILIN